MKINVSDIMNVRKLPKGFHLVKIIEVIDGKLETANQRLDYFDCVFHGTEGFIISRFFNNSIGIEKIITLFKVCGIKTPLNYKINNLLLKHNYIIIQVDEKENLHGDLDLGVVSYYLGQRIENSDCNLPEDIQYIGFPNDLDWDEIYQDVIDPENGQIRDKYKDL
jgi:hypothetical protein